MSTIIRPRHFGLAPAPKTQSKPDHRGTLLTPLVILCAWATMVGFYHIIAFIGAALDRLVSP